MVFAKAPRDSISPGFKNHSYFKSRLMIEEKAGSLSRSGLPPIRSVTFSYTNGATSLNSGLDTVRLAEKRNA